MTKNAFYFILKALFILKIFKFLSGLSGHIEKWLDHKVNVNFEIYETSSRRLIPDLFLFFKNVLCKEKASGVQLYFDSPQISIQ